MTSLAFGWRGGRVLSLYAAALFIASSLPACPSAAAEAKGTTTAERLVQEALESEVAGDAPRHATLLEEAVRIAPNYSLARWHSGQIAVGDQWQTVEDAQQVAAADPHQAEYQRLRQQYGDSPAGQLALARWCRKNDLFDESRLHWASVLSVEPENKEAQRALGARWSHGRLMTYAQIDHAKRQMKASQKAARRWAPKINKWQRDIADELDVRMQALDEIREVKDIHAIPALEEVSLQPDLSTELETVRSRQFGEAVVAALDEMPDRAATESLVRLAVLAPLDDVRDAAVDALKRRPLHDYVPLLLSGLAMPIESWFRVTTDPDGSVHYQHPLYREGQHGDWSLDAGRVVWQHDFGGRRTIVDREGKFLGIARPRVSD